MNILINKMIGPRCITKEDGQRVYEAIHENLKNSESVELDFENVSQFASPFFNFAIGQLLKDIKEDGLRKLLQIKNMDKAGRLVVERVMENAARYHGNEDYKKIVDEILAQQAEGVE